VAVGIKTTVGFNLTNIKLNERGCYALLNSQRGPVARHVRDIGKVTVRIAKVKAGKKTGLLRRTIKMTRDRSQGIEYSVLVGSDVNHALVHHQGAEPHVIVPKKPDGWLAFRGKNGQTVVTKRVNHPGHAPNPYLVIALEEAMRR